MANKKHKYTKKEKVVSKTGKSYTRYYYAVIPLVAAATLYAGHKLPSMNKLAKLMGVSTKELYKLPKNQVTRKLYSANMSKSQVKVVMRTLAARRATRKKMESLSVKVKPKPRKNIPTRRGQLKEFQPKAVLTEKEFRGNLKAAMVAAGKI